MKCCENCRYWVRSYKRDCMGSCHRNAPTRDKHGVCTWPLTHQCDYCGDYDG